MDARLWRYLRRFVQLLLLALFLYLIVSTIRESKAPVPVNIFSRSDPLLALSSMVASRQVLLTFVPAIIIVLATLALGRFWCGWICPLGTVLDLFGFRGRRGIPERLRQAKYFILFIILFAALFANLTLLFLDPITIFVRALSSVIYPGLQQAAIAYPQIQPFIKWVVALPSGNFRPLILLDLALPLVVILGLNLVARRFWCRYLCPLGALLGLLSRFAWIKRRISKVEGLRPCRLDCPAGTNVAGYVALISQGRFKDAVDLIRESNPFPTVCGHVCPHPCENGCNRGEFDEPIAIGELERFATDYMREHGKDGAKPVPITNKEKVAIIGAGPAGLTAAFHLRKMGYYVKVFEKQSVPGGMLATGIPKYRLPWEVLQNDMDYVKGIGVEIETGVEIDKQRFEDLRKQYDALFIAVGSHQSRKLGIEGEDLAGVIHGVDFLRDLNLGKEVKVGNRVAVVGGGDVAIDAARCALRLGAEVTIVYRRSREEMPARAEEVREAEEEGAKITYLAAPTRIVGRNGYVEGMECIRMELGAPDESGRRRPVPIEGSEFMIDVDMVMPAIGQSSDLSFLEGSGVETQQGRIITDDHFMTTQAGIFAGGDAVTGPATVAEAIGMGRKAAIAINGYLRGTPFPEEVGVKRTKFEDFPKQRLPKEREARRKTPLIPLERRKQSFDEVRIGLNREDAIAEARRCLNWTCSECSECTSCARAVCPMGCIDGKDFTSDPGECIQCLDCLAPCPVGAINFGEKKGLSWGYDYDFSRRELLASLAAGVAWTGLMKIGLAKQKSPHLLRPPGARDSEFLTKCVRCGQCIKVCPNSALHLSLFEGGWEGFWTPILVPRVGYCDYSCNACGQVCPSQAIPPLPLEEKRKAVIGTAQVNFDRCIRCLKCIAVCPAEALEEGRVKGRKGAFPIVAAERCIGCGTCEYICPVEGEAAIRVYAPGALPG
jgi:NADPH-dependent glutamate synthase beta subunit-like oxidoreductase/polyferredoxin/ferredoxin-like protein FixX